MKKQRIMIAGPTASGKSSLAVRLAECIDGEIISADSRQCYRLLDIGTAKPDKELLGRVPHHNISVLNPDENDSASDFRRRAEKAAEEIENRGKNVIYCGGSTLHLRSVVSPLDDMPSSNPGNLKKLSRRAEKEGLETLYDELLQADPVYAGKMDGLNRQRIFRALDVWMQTGKPFSSFHKNEPVSPPEALSVFALHHPRKQLHRRISVRTEQMIKDGLVEETRHILNAGYGPDLQSLQTVGYKQAIQFLNREISHQKMTDDIKTATRRYAKRQITWLRRWPFVRWLDMTEKTEKEWAEAIARKVYGN